jgi:hypothetical protein
MVAMRGSHPLWGAIFALNLLLGWTLIGWVVALVWAGLGTQKRTPLFLHQH